MDDPPKPRHPVRSIVMNIVFFILMGAGTFQMYRGASALFSAYSSTSWPTTRGQMIVSSIQRNLGEEPEFTSNIEYVYQLDGQRFTETSIYPGDSSSSSYRLRMVTHYPKGSVQTVHHHPIHPATAFLETGVYQYTFIPFLFGSLIFSFGAAFGVILFLSSKYPAYATEGGYNFPTNHPVSIVILGFLLVIATQFALIFYFHR